MEEVVVDSSFLDSENNNIKQTFNKDQNYDNQNDKSDQMLLNCADDAVRKLKSGFSYEYGSLEIVNGSESIKNEPK